MTHGALAHNGMEIIATLQGLFTEADISSLAINLSLGLDDRHGMYDCATPHTHKHSDALNEIDVWLDWLETQGANNNILSPADDRDPFTGIPHHKYTLCRVEPISS